MPRKVYLAPPPATRVMSLALIVLGVLFLLSGIVFATVAEGEAKPFVLIFLLIWSVGCITIIVHAVKSLRLIKDGKIKVAEFDVSGGETETDFATKLRDLEALKNDSLVSVDEYRRKRAEIMREKW